MNERIKELATQAYRSVNPGPDPYNEAEAAWLGLGPLERKFAELIVQECANWMRNERNDAGDRIGDSFYWSDRMLTHFDLEDSGTFRS